MATQVLLDAGVVTRCRRRVHLEHDPGLADAELAPPDPAAAQRIADAAAHRRTVAETMAALIGDGWTIIPEGRTGERERATVAAMMAGAAFISRPVLPRDHAGGRRGRIDLLVRAGGGYVPVLVVRHRVTDPGSGSYTSTLADPLPAAGGVDPARKARSQPRDQMRLAHAVRMLQAAGHGSDTAFGGVIGMDADVVLWYDLRASTWPGGRSAMAEYDVRFDDRLAVAGAAARGEQPLAWPSRILECRNCPWWPRCSAELTAARDVSLVVRGEDAGALREAEVRTVDALAAADPAGPPPEPMSAGRYGDAIVLAKAWLAGLAMVRRVRELRVPRADVEVDVDMESFGDSGAYLWGCWLSGAAVGEASGYRAFVTWDPLPTIDEGRSFGEFWRWFSGLRARVHERGMSFAAYCYNELAENRWLLASADRFTGQPQVPRRAEVQAFIDSPDWVDLYRLVSEQFLCARGKGLKVVAPVSGFRWRDPEAGGENSMRWYRDAVAMDGGEPDLGQRKRLLEYNEDDVCATRSLREWMA
ncbi:MAG: TM0106 family RecB-like putative nuclease, partial [Sciscionella sp.]